MKNKMSKSYSPQVATYLVAKNQGIDVVGDIHGCLDELIELLTKAGYEIGHNGRDYTIDHPENRLLFFVGDIIDRGPRNLDTLRFVRALMGSGRGSVTIGNHDFKLLRKLHGVDVAIQHGLEGTLKDIERADQAEQDGLRGMLRSMPTQIIIEKRADDKLGAAGTVIVVHGAAPEEHQGLKQNNSFHPAIYGIPDDLDADGNLARKDWAEDYTGDAIVVHGHVPTPKVISKNNVHNLDTGCAFGGHMTLMRVYEQEFLQVRAKDVYHFRNGFLKD